MGPCLSQSAGPMLPASFRLGPQPWRFPADLGHYHHGKAIRAKGLLAGSVDHFGLHGLSSHRGESLQFTANQHSPGASFDVCSSLLT